MANVERRILEFPASPAPPYRAGSAILLDHAQDGTVSALIEDVVPTALARKAPSVIPPVLSDYIPVVRGTSLLILPAQFFYQIVPVVGATNGLMTPTMASQLALLNPNRQLPPGGAAGQVLGKSGAGDYSTAWVNQTGGTPGGGTGAVNDVVNNGAGSGLGLVIGLAGGIVTIRKLVTTTAGLVIGLDASGNALFTINPATDLAQGLMSAAHYSKLNTIQQGAQVNPNPYVGVTAGLVPVPLSSPPSTARFLAEDGVWRAPAGVGGGTGGTVPEAPLDDSMYARQNGLWVPFDTDVRIVDLLDVDSTGATAGVQLVYGSDNFWHAQAVPFPRLEQLPNVQISAPGAGDALIYNTILQKWVNGVVSAVADANIPKGAAVLTGPATHAFVAGDAGKVTKCDLAAGDVVVTFDNTVATPAGMLLASSFLTQNGNGTYKLKFDNAVTAVQPGILGSAVGFRTTGVTATAMAQGAVIGTTPAGSDTRVLNVPAGTNRTITFILAGGRANLANPNELRLEVSIAGAPIFTIGGATPVTDPAWDLVRPGATGGVTSDFDLWVYTKALGTSVDQTAVTTRVVHTNLNTNGYTLHTVYASDVDQGSPGEGYVHGKDTPGTSPAMSISVTTLGPARRALFFGNTTTNIATYPVPNFGTPATAQVLTTSTMGTASLNRATSNSITGHKDASSAGAYTATITFPLTGNRIAFGMALKPAVVPTMDIRAPGNATPETTVTNKQIGVLFDSNEKIVNLIM